MLYIYQQSYFRNTTKKLSFRKHKVLVFLHFFLESVSNSLLYCDLDFSDINSLPTQTKLTNQLSYNNTMPI
jgi:hypothetical protein